MNAPEALPPAAPGLDTRVVLALGMQAAPGAYAVLLGSGMSRAAGVPTAWDVVRSLIQRVAAAEGADLSDRDQVPELWWEEQGRGEPRYDDLVGALASTEAARQRLLAEYFEPGSRESGILAPTEAHAALARLVASGRVRLILTTNLDRLTERALDQAGVAAEVISAPEQVQSMTPLTHASATVIKLHGDYATLGARNTAEELASYPRAWQELLGRVFGDYGLIVVGWSARYDRALVGALSTAPRHPFPAFWVTHRDELTEEARRVIDLRRAASIPSAGADEFFNDLNSRIDRLDRAALRRSRPRRLTLYTQHFQDSGSPQPGWVLNPLLQVRVVTVAGPVSDEETSGIGPEQREALLGALRQSPATARIRSLALPAVNADVRSGEEASASALTDWHSTPHQYQSTALASCRLGGEGVSGTSALAGIELPQITRSNIALLTADCGLSVARALALHELALLLRDLLVLTSGPMFDAIEDIVAVDAEPIQAQMYIVASSHVGNGLPQRENDLSTRLDLTPLGSTDRPPARVMTYAAELAGALVELDAGELVLGAIRQCALDAGYLDPRAGLRALRAQMGLPAQA